MGTTQAEIGTAGHIRDVIIRLTTAVETKRASQRERMRVRRVALAISEEARIAAQREHGRHYRRLAS